MAKDFSGQNLCGLSFKGHDLTGANFERASIKGVNFTNAVLKNANFSYIKTSLPKQWSGLLLLSVLLLAALSGMTSGVGFYLVIVLLKTEVIALSKVSSITVLISLFALLVTTIYKGVVIGLTTGVFILIPALIISATSTNDIAIASVGIVLFVGGTAQFAIVSSYIGAALSTIGAMITFNSMPIAMAVTSSIAVVSAMALKEIIAVPTTVIVFLFGNYIAWRAIAGDERFCWIRKTVVAFITIGGTSFRGANITDANFTGAILKSTDFRGAILTRTRWYQAKNIDFARVDDSILAQDAVRDLLISGNGYKKSYVGANLKGANLSESNLNEANFKEADISQATLQRANLEGANLTKSQAVGTDFTNTYLTGACLEAWNIDSTTKLDDVDCRYVYLLENPNLITGDRERRPHDYDKVFEPGDFEKLYKKIMNTVQILLRNGVNSEAFALAFRKLMEENPEITPDSIRAMEKKDNDVLLTLEVPQGIDKGKVQRDFEAVYEARLEAQKQAALLDAEIRHSKEIKEITMALATHPSSLGNLLSNLTIIASGENTTMTDNKNQGVNATGSFVNTGEMNNMTGSTINLGEISGAVNNTVNQLPAAPEPNKPGIKELLTQLQEAIQADTTLTEEDKAEALEQVKALAEAGKNPQEGEAQKTAKTAMKILKGTIVGLPSAATLVEACNKLLPAIASVLGLA